MGFLENDLTLSQVDEDHWSRQIVGSDPKEQPHYPATEPRVLRVRRSHDQRLDDHLPPSGLEVSPHPFICESKSLSFIELSGGEGHGSMR